MALRRQRNHIIASVQTEEMAYDHYVLVLFVRPFRRAIHGHRSECDILYIYNIMKTQKRIRLRDYVRD